MNADAVMTSLNARFNTFVTPNWSVNPTAASDRIDAVTIPNPIAGKRRFNASPQPLTAANSCGVSLANSAQLFELASQ